MRVPASKRNLYRGQNCSAPEKPPKDQRWRLDPSGYLVGTRTRRLNLPSFGMSDIMARPEKEFVQDVVNDGFSRSSAVSQDKGLVKVYANILLDWIHRDLRGGLTGTFQHPFFTPVHRRCVPQLLGGPQLVPFWRVGAHDKQLGWTNEKTGSGRSAFDSHSRKNSFSCFYSSTTENRNRVIVFSGSLSQSQIPKGSLMFASNLSQFYTHFHRHSGRSSSPRLAKRPGEPWEPPTRGLFVGRVE